MVSSGRPLYAPGVAAAVHARDDPRGRPWFPQPRAARASTAGTTRRAARSSSSRRRATGSEGLGTRPPTTPQRRRRRTELWARRRGNSLAIRLDWDWRNSVVARRRRTPSFLADPPLATRRVPLLHRLSPDPGRGRLTSRPRLRGHPIANDGPAAIRATSRRRACSDPRPPRRVAPWPRSVVAMAIVWAGHGPLIH